MAHPDGWVHGVDGKVFLGSTELAVTDFDGNWSVDSANVTPSTAGGARVSVDGIESFDGTIRFVYNRLTKLTVAPRQLKPRTYATFHLKPDGADDFSFLGLCKSFNFKSGPKSGEVTVEVAVESQGPITYPVS